MVVIQRVTLGTVHRGVVAYKIEPMLFEDCNNVNDENRKNIQYSKTTKKGVAIQIGVACDAAGHQASCKCSLGCMGEGADHRPRSLVIVGARATDQGNIQKQT